MHALALTRGLPIDDPESLVDVDLLDPVPGPHDLQPVDERIVGRRAGATVNQVARRLERHMRPRRRTT
jgi:hypothetical protein